MRARRARQGSVQLVLELGRQELLRAAFDRHNDLSLVRGQPTMASRCVEDEVAGTAEGA